MCCVPSVTSEGGPAVVFTFVRESLDAGKLREELAEVARGITSSGPDGGSGWALASMMYGAQKIKFCHERLGGSYGQHLEVASRRGNECSGGTT